MGVRYCPECKRWLSTDEYTVDESGETICPEHKAVHGYLCGPFPLTVGEFYSDVPAWYGDRSKMLDAAVGQHLVVM